MNKFYFLAIIALFTSFSCKKDKVNKVSNPSNESLPSLQETKAAQASLSLVKLLRADDAFIKESATQKPFPMITDSLWNIYFALSISQETPKENIYKGHWIDLKEDGSYLKGVYDSEYDQGKFVYRPQTKTIELRSTMKDTSSEWTVKVDPDAMVLIGTERFNNNSWQIKLLRKSEKPKAGVPLKNDKSM